MKLNELKERVQKLSTNLAIKEAELKKVMASLKENGIDSIEKAKKAIPNLQKELSQLETERQKYVNEAEEIIREFE